jgi:hypothetical protein
MTWYAFLLFAHVSMAVIWIGGGLMMQLFGVRASMLGDRTRLANLGEDISFIGPRLFVPASLLAFLTGVLLVPRVGLLRVRRRLDRHRPRAVCDDLPHGTALSRSGIRISWRYRVALAAGSGPPPAPESA